MTYSTDQFQALLPSSLYARIEERVIPAADDSELYEETFIEIREIDDDQKLVTVIEFVSPSNKRPGNTRDDYIRKPKECRRSGIALVQIDLTREGPREGLLPEDHMVQGPNAVYLACSERGLGSRRFEVYHLPLAHPLPAIKIPLHYADPDVVLDLQPLIDQSNRNGRCDRIDYSRPLVPPLPAPEAQWVAERLAAIRPGQGQT